MKPLLTICAVAILVLALSSGAEAAINFAGQAEKNPPLTGIVEFDTSNMYLTATVQDAAIALDEDYLAIAIDADNDNLWTEGKDAILVYDYYNNDGPSWRVVDTLEYSGGVWDCPWSTSDKRKPGDALWPSGLSIEAEASNNDLLYTATIPFSAIGVQAGDTIGILVQTRDKNVAMYGGNGKVLNYWPASTCFNALYDPAQFEKVVIPTPEVICTTIQDGTLLTSTGEVIYTGYDDWGYNYQAHMYNGLYGNYSRPDPPIGEDSVTLQMKWNDAWLSNKDCDGDSLLDRHYGFDSYIGSGAWLTNHQSGSDTMTNDKGKTKTYHWTYFVKIVAVPIDAHMGVEADGEDTTKWYEADGTEIGPAIWGAFAIIQEVYNDPLQGVHGKQYLSPAGPGFGQYKP